MPHLVTYSVQYYVSRVYTRLLGIIAGMNITTVFYVHFAESNHQSSQFHSYMYLFVECNYYLGSLYHSKNEFAVLVILSYEMLSVEAESTYHFCLQCKVARSKRSAHNKHFLLPTVSPGQRKVLRTYWTTN